MIKIIDYYIFLEEEAHNKLMNSLENLIII